MWHSFAADSSLSDNLMHLDEAAAAQVKAACCPHCGGRLDRADYPRKPRGGGIAAVLEVCVRRISLCCGRPGCRRRVTPPSVRFLGRRVYLGVTLLVACLRALTQPASTETPTDSGVPSRTVGRWLDWWQTTFAGSAFFTASAGRFVPPLEVAQLPASLVARFTPPEPGARLAAVLSFLAPITTTSARARFLRSG
jgi:hypothetical protein